MLRAKCHRFQALKTRENHREFQHKWYKEWGERDDLG